MEPHISKHVNKRKRSGNPAHIQPTYTYQDHMSYADEKIKSVESLSEDQARRFKDSAVEIISDLFEGHEGVVIDINNPPSIAMDLSNKKSVEAITNSREQYGIPSTSLDQPSSPKRSRPQSLRAHSEQYLMGSTSEDVMMAKKSYTSQYPRSRKHHLGKHSRTSHTSTSKSSSQASDTSTRTVSQEPAPQSSLWYLLPPTPKIIDTIILDSD